MLPIQRNLFIPPSDRPSNVQCRPVFNCRRTCSLDVEISASGYTKAMQQDDELLHPEGPEGAEGLSEDEEDPEKDLGEPADLRTDEGVDLEEYKQAMLELEGLRLGEEDTGKKGHKREPSQDQTDCDPGQRLLVHTDTDEEKREQGEPEHNTDDTETRIEAQEVGGAVPVSLGSDEELGEEDECPELVDLSAINKEFKPFRYMEDFLSHSNNLARLFSYSLYS